MTSAPQVMAVVCSLIVATLAFAPWLAHLTDRVDAVVSGGFEIAGDYSPLYPEIQALSAAAEADPAAWADVTSRFDNRAALTFYRELSELPPDFLIGSLPCPLFAFWGEDDEEIAKAGGVQLLAAGLDRYGHKHASFPGHDHEGMLAHINEAIPSVLAWFDGLGRYLRASGNRYASNDSAHPGETPDCPGA